MLFFSFSFTKSHYVLDLHGPYVLFVFFLFGFCLLLKNLWLKGHLLFGAVKL